MLRIPFLREAADFSGQRHHTVLTYTPIWEDVVCATGSMSRTSRARLVDRPHAKTTPASIRFSMHDRLELLRPGDTGIECPRSGKRESIVVKGNDLVFLQNASMTDATSFGSMTSRAEDD